MVTTSLTLALALACLSLPLLSVAHSADNPHAGLLRRQETTRVPRHTTARDAAATPTRRRTTAAAAATKAATTTALVVPVGSPPVPLATTYPAGSVSPIKGAPVLPDCEYSRIPFAAELLLGRFL